MNSGFLAENNETRDKIVIKVHLDENDYLHDIKLGLINQPHNFHTFNLSPNFKPKNTYEMICWCRYVCFDESQAYLVILKNQTIIEAKKAHTKRGLPIEQFNEENIFRGTECQVISIENERMVLKKI